MIFLTTAFQLLFSLLTTAVIIIIINVLHRDKKGRQKILEHTTECLAPRFCSASRHTKNKRRKTLREITSKFHSFCDKSIKTHAAGPYSDFSIQEAGTGLKREVILHDITLRTMILWLIALQDDLEPASYGDAVVSAAGS